MSLKQPPSDFNAERAILSCLMRRNAVLDDLARVLDVSDFFFEPHKVVAQTIFTLNAEGKAFDLISVRSKLNSDGKLQDAGGDLGLSDILESASSATNIIHYGEIVAEKARLRKLIEVSEVSARLAGSDGVNSKDIMQRLEKELASMSDKLSVDDCKHIREIASRSYDRIKETYEKGFQGLRTGFTELDNMAGGFHPGELILIAGRPASGKTSMAMDIAENVARNGEGVLAFSLEMNDEDLCIRMLSGRTGINGQNLKRGDLHEGDWDNLIDSVNKVSEYALHVDDNASINLFEMKAIAKKVKRNGNLKLILVDYLQLMGGDKKSENRQNEVSEISRGLKKMAKDLGVPIVALSQLSRAVEHRSGKKRPQLSDLRETGSLEQDADMVLMIYRPEVYGEGIVEINGVEYPADGMAEIIIAKQRNGPIGSFWLNFDKQITRFTNFEVRQEWDGRE